MEYFYMGIFVIPWVYLIRKYGSQTQAFFLLFSQIFRHRAWIYLRTENSEVICLLTIQDFSCRVLSQYHFRSSRSAVEQGWPSKASCPLGGLNSWAFFARFMPCARARVVRVTYRKRVKVFSAMRALKVARLVFDESYLFRLYRFPLFIDYILGTQLSMEYLSLPV